MSNPYVVFWYPSLYHTSFLLRPVINEKINDDDISDYSPISEEEKAYPHFIHVEKQYRSDALKEKDKADLAFRTYKKNPDKNGVGGEAPIYNFTLKYEERSNNGFVVYSYNPEEIDFSSSEGEQLLKSVYHHAKSLYHRHEVNHAADSGLYAYHVDSEEGFIPKTILQANNCVLQFFLMQYENKFKDYVNLVSDMNSLFAHLEDSSRNFVDLQNKGLVAQTDFEDLESPILNVIRTIGHDVPFDYKNQGIDKKLNLLKKHILHYIGDLCEDAMIEYAYCCTLLDSKYNIDSRSTRLFTKEELLIHTGQLEEKEEGQKEELNILDQRRKVAVNIVGAINYLKCVMSRCSNYDYRVLTTEVLSDITDSSNKGNVLTKRTFIYGIIATIIFSILSAVISSLLS